MAIKIIYTVFLAIMVSLFVGLGISAFYPAPKMPDQSEKTMFATLDPGQEETAEMKAEREQADREWRDYQESLSRYNQNVSLIALISAIIIMTVSLLLGQKILLLADGLLAGGAITLVYAIGRGMMGENDKYKFIAVSVGLVIALALGYIKFVRPGNLHTETDR
ncbi:MAG: hypothetical protein BWY68_00958 [bacterium ADurb.Bin400]|nr:MAG: hypothetical protein BWY68_00958 [bacterium ADurb.Bin400]